MTDYYCVVCGVGVDLTVLSNVYDNWQDLDKSHVCSNACLSKWNLADTGFIMPEAPELPELPIFPDLHDSLSEIDSRIDAIAHSIHDMENIFSDIHKRLKAVEHSCKLLSDALIADMKNNERLFNLLEKKIEMMNDGREKNKIPSI